MNLRGWLFALILRFLTKGKSMGVLDGRVAVITGGGHGLGRAYALRFAAEGAQVVVNSRSVDEGAESSAQAVADEIERAGGAAVAHTGSVSDWKTGAALVECAVNTFGRLDVLVNNAGFLRDKMLVGMPESDWDDVVAVHLKGQFVPLRFAAAYWREQHKAGNPVQAAVINTTAGAGLHGNVGQANYAAAKAGAAALSLVAARELQRYGVRVNTISPLALTRMSEAVLGPLKTVQPSAEPAKNDDLDPDNIAALAVFLASPKCATTGQVFNAFGRRLGIYRGWTVVERLESETRWTVDALAAALAHLPSDPPPFDPM